MDEQTFMEVWLDLPSKAGISTDRALHATQSISKHVTRRCLGDAHSPLEDPIIGGIVNLPAFDRFATEPDERLRGQ